MSHTEVQANEETSRRWRAVAGWVLLGLAWRTLLAALAPLFPDETYYWEWSRRLEAGYFDHPPAIAYLIAFGTGLLGDTTAGVRLGSAIAAVVTQLSAVAIAVRLGGHAAGVRAAMLTTLLPIATLGLVLATPDAPLMASAMLALVFVERALASAPRSSRSTAWWLAAGVALGVAFISKYTAVLLPAALLAACIAHPALRIRLREPGPYLASIIALVLFSPVVAWNAFNDWISFRFQLGHGFGSGAKGNVLTRELDLLGGQLGVATPILFVLMLMVAVTVFRTGWRTRRETAPTHAGARIFALSVLTILPLLFFAVSATRRSVEANWPALMYPGAIALLAISTASFARGRWWRWGAGLAFALLAIMTVQAWRPVLPLAPRKDPIARAHGWDGLAVAVERARADAFLEGSVDRWVAAERYQDASALAFHLRDHPPVFSLNLQGRPNQYDLWRTPYEALRPGDGLVAVFDANPAGDERAQIVAGWFGETREGPVVVLRRGAGEVAHRRIWLYRDARNVPRDNNRSPVNPGGR